MRQEKANYSIKRMARFSKVSRYSYLVERPLRMAYTLRGEVPDGMVFHDDRGSQFTSEQL